MGDGSGLDETSGNTASDGAESGHTDTDGEADGGAAPKWRKGRDLTCGEWTKGARGCPGVRAVTKGDSASTTATWEPAETPVPGPHPDLANQTRGGGSASTTPVVPGPARTGGWCPGGQRAAGPRERWRPYTPALGLGTADVPAGVSGVGVPGHHGTWSCSPGLCPRGARDPFPVVAKMCPDFTKCLPGNKTASR